MKKYYFSIPTTGVENIVVEANSLDEASQLVADGEYDSDLSEYITEDWDTPFRCDLKEWVKEHSDNIEGR